MELGRGATSRSCVPPGPAETGATARLGRRSASRGRADSSQGSGARQPSRPPGSTRRSVGDHGVEQAELLSLVEERRAAQGEEQHRGSPRPGLAPPRAVAVLALTAERGPGRSGCGARGLSWFERTQVGQASRGSSASTVFRMHSDQADDLPAREERREVEGQVELVAGPVVGARPPRSRSRKTSPTHEPVAG